MWPKGSAVDILSKEQIWDTVCLTVASEYVSVSWQTAYCGCAVVQQLLNMQWGGGTQRVVWCVKAGNSNLVIHKLDVFISAFKEAV